ncbi:uncharacterized protein LOC111366515 [Olea europaea var. sylvestris]|uniref:uncharacterized protein LOC111366515 n=1 Tax=Olea europaea var. sylvestris TaxID=158386 RepID=UPI000C1D80F3|nr:uncharacterized protein LOC111366515 [Olea europaea var. sylvestris]
MAEFTPNVHASQEQQYSTPTILGGEESYAFTQHIPSSTMIQPATTNVILNYDGNVIHNCYPHAPHIKWAHACDGTSKGNDGEIHYHTLNMLSIDVTKKCLVQKGGVLFC